jgi:hypothetical protein
MYITQCVVPMLPRCQGIKEGAHKDLIDAKVNVMIKGLSHELDRAFDNKMDRSRLQ